MTDILSPKRLERSRSEDNENFVHAFARGLQVIRTFSDGAEKQTLSDVARRANISRASARRLLHTLFQLGYVDFDGKQFWLKPKILDLGYSYVSSLELAGIAQDAMSALAAKVQSSCSISILEGHDVVYVARAMVSMITSRVFAVGNRIPAHALSMGRIQLAALSDEALDDYLATAELKRYTPYTVTDPVQLREILIADREMGWSVVRRELDEGVCAMGMPLLGRDGETIAGLGLGLKPDLSHNPAFLETMRQEMARTVGTINELMRLRA